MTRTHVRLARCCGSLSSGGVGACVCVFLRAEVAAEESAGGPGAGGGETDGPQWWMYPSRGRDLAAWRKRANPGRRLWRVSANSA